MRPDLRGFGETPLPGGPFSYVDDVRALLDHLRLAETALVGNSFGGRVALDVALEHPGLVSALVLVSSALTGWDGSPELDAFDVEEERLLDGGRIDEAVELNLRTWLDGPERGAAPVQADVRERVAAMQRRALEVAVAAWDGDPPPGPVRWSEPPAAQRLDEVAAPTLVVTGAHDLPGFRALGELLAREIPGAEHVVLDTAHLPGLERPDELNRLLAGFLG